VRGIRATQPKGPYAVAGYSYGGVVAFEIAKALERQGERVAFVGAINVPPHISAIRRTIDLLDTAGNLAFLLSLCTKEQAMELPATLRGTMPTPQAIARFVEIAPKRRLAELDLDVARFTRWAEVAFSLVRLARAYEPSGQVDSLRVFYTSPPIIYRGVTKQMWLDDQLRHWDTFARRPNRYIEVAGEHQVLMGKHVASFQAQLRRELHAALAT
jgi:thioesterase domain-containing protein